MAVDPNELYDQLMRQNTAEQDIQAIAKQISDHAEAIYQTWKSKGLTPNELLHLHSGVSGANKNKHATDATTQSQSGQTVASATMSGGVPFRQQQQQQMAAGGRSVPTQSSSRSSATPERRKSSSSLSPVELLASPQLEATLEQLVNSFVQEDKARLASTRGRTASPAPSSPSPCATSSSSSPLSSSSPAGLHPAAAAAAAHPSASPIQTALKRFEKRGLNYESTARPLNAAATGGNGRNQSPAPTGNGGSAATIDLSASHKSSPTTFQEAMQSASIAGRTPSAPSPPLTETSSDTVKSRAQRFVSRVEMANAPLSSSSLPSLAATSTGHWPAAKRPTTPTPTAVTKSRSTFSTNSTTTTTTTTTIQQQQQKQTVLTEVVHFVGADSTTAQVDKEEQKLINALKTGQIINSNNEGINISNNNNFAPVTMATESLSTAPDQFLVNVKKTKERQLQQQQQQQQQRSAARTVSSAEAKAEAELETLVDRLKCIDGSSMSDDVSLAHPSAAAPSSATGARGAPASSAPSLRASRESSPAHTLLGPQYQRDSASPARSSSPRCFKLSETVPIAGVSNVDYAKVRYQAAQANPLTQQRLEDSRTIGKAQNAPQPNVVSETRSRFEGATAAAAAGRGLQTVNSSPVPWRASSSERVIATTTTTNSSTSECWSPVRSAPGQQQSIGNDQIDSVSSTSTLKFPSTAVEGNQQPTLAGGGLNLDALRRIKSRKLRKSPEPQASQAVAGGSGGGSSGNSNTSSPTSSPLPHPELTLQQRQHLRERNLQQLQQQQQQQQHGASASVSGSGGIQIQYTSSGVPIRPFLTRGSVAERVLIFEKCPTALGHGLSDVSGSRLERAYASVGGSTGDAASGSTSSSPSSSAAAAAALMEKTAKRAGSPAPHALAWRVHSSNDVHNRTQGYAKDNNKENRSTSPSISSPRSTLRRQAKSNNNLLVPRFYYPTGRPISKEQSEGSMQRVASIFQQLPNGQASREHFGTIAKACSCPFYWKSLLFIASGGEKLGHISLDAFVDFWKKIITNYHDEASRFVQLLTLINPNGNSGGQYGGRMDSNFNGFSVASNGVSSRAYLVPEDFVPLVQDVVDTHPGLTFLKEAAEFHSRYVHTVIARIFYNVNRSWSGHITLAELRHSNLLSTVRLLEEEEDINQITDYFSYEHFYVIYCKFWELDKDHDLFIDKKDLARHNDHALSSKMIDRIFSGAVTRGSSHSSKLAQAKFTPVANSNNINMNNQPRMSYTEFVWFLISEEDKRHPTAIEYWFRCMDLDGDGYLSMYELEYFYEEQLQRMESLGIETLPFEDCLCQMLDMIHPAVPGKVSLNDLKRCQMTPIFFDTFFNLEKYLDHEQRDPFASQRDPDSENGDDLLKISDWDRYAAEEYELLVAEEGSPDHNEDMFMREEMATTEEEEHASVPIMERDVIMSETDMPNDHYDSLAVHSLGSNHRSLFSVNPCSIEYQY